MKEKAERQRLIREFVQLLKKTPDDWHSIEKIISFLGMVASNNNVIPPTAEFVTILKHKRPIIFQHLKKAVSSTSRIYFILQLDMDYDTALERLDITPDTIV